MTWRKIFRRIVSALFIIGFLLVNAVSHAEIYTGEGSYIMSKAETLEVSRERAKADAMRNACEQAGVYVKNYSRMKNFKLEEDIIETMTANIIKLLENPQFKMLESVDNLEGILIHVIIKVEIDDSDILRWLKKDEHQKSELVAQMEALRKANAEQERQIAELKRQLANNPQDKERIAQEFANEDKIFLSNQKVEEAWKFYGRGDYKGAIKLHTEAIEFNPDNALAYYGRAYAYDDLENYQQAIEDCTKAVQFNSPRLVDAYNNRGEAYRKSGNYAQAIADYNKALEFNPNYAKAYNNRGIAYRHLNQYNLAIADYNKALQLNPNYVLAYNNRGWVYYLLKKYERALKDFDKALEINPNFTLAKNNRDACLKAMGN